MIVIQDEQLSERLNQIAQRKNQSIEDVLRSLLERDDEPPTAFFVETTETTDEAVKRIRENAYAEARRYWRETGNSDRLALTDAELDDQFWTFDAQGHPLLKSDQGTVELHAGSGWALAEAAVNADLSSIAEVEDFDEILNREFGDYIWDRKFGSHGSDTNSD